MGPQFSAVCGILGQATEFACFCRISTFPQNFTDYCNGWWKGEKCSIHVLWSGLGGHGKLITICRHDCAIKYSSFNVGNIENVEHV